MPETANDSYEVENDNNDGRYGLKSREGRKNQLAISNGQQLAFMLIITHSFDQFIICISSNPPLLNTSFPMWGSDQDLDEIKSEN